MIKIYATSLDLQHLFDNKLVSNCLLVFVFFFDIISTIFSIFIKYFLSYDLFINIRHDDYLIIYYRCKLNFIDKIITYYNHNQV